MSKYFLYELKKSRKSIGIWIFDLILFGIIATWVFWGMNRINGSEVSQDSKTLIGSLNLFFGNETKIIHLAIIYLFLSLLMCNLLYNTFSSRRNYNNYLISTPIKKANLILIKWGYVFFELLLHTLVIFTIMSIELNIMFSLKYATVIFFTLFLLLPIFYLLGATYGVVRAQIFPFILFILLALYHIVFAASSLDTRNNNYEVGEISSLVYNNGKPTRIVDARDQMDTLKSTWIMDKLDFDNYIPQLLFNGYSEGNLLIETSNNTYGYYSINYKKTLDNIFNEIEIYGQKYYQRSLVFDVLTKRTTLSTIGFDNDHLEFIKKQTNEVDLNKYKYIYDFQYDEDLYSFIKSFVDKNEEKIILETKRELEKFANDNVIEKSFSLSTTISALEEVVIKEYLGSDIRKILNPNIHLSLKDVIYNKLPSFLLKNNIKELYDNNFSTSYSQRVPIFGLNYSLSSNFNFNSIQATVFDEIDHHTIVNFKDYFNDPNMDEDTRVKFLLEYELYNGTAYVRYDNSVRWNLFILIPLFLGLYYVTFYIQKRRVV